MTKPRAHQVKALEMMRGEFRKGHKWVCVVMPTGTGKAYLGAFTIQSHLEKDEDHKVLVVAHREELVGQLYDTITSLGIRCGVIQANPTREVNAKRRVQVASIQTLVARDIHLEGITMFVYDECHHSLSNGWSELALKYKSTGAFSVGLTATPLRSDDLPLGDVYDAMVCPISVREAIEQGFLVDYELFRPKAPLKKLQIAQSPVSAWKQHARGLKTVVFAANVASAKKFTEEFIADGIPAALVDGKTPTGERRQILADFKKGKVKVICNCGVLTEGFDDPETACVILARNVGSVSLFLQMLGRALRLYEGKDRAILIDLFGSSHVHGEPKDDREWSLDGDGIRKKKLEQAEERFCPGCGVLMDAEASMCSECGKEGPGITTPEVVNQPLVKYAHMRKKTPEQRSSSLAKWLAEAAASGHKPGKAFYKYKAVFGEWPPKDVINAATKRSVQD